MKTCIKKLSALLLLLNSVFLFAENFSLQEILSPVEGIWANKQMLVIDDASDGEYFYSLNGSDPETFGFAYDGPVLIDLTGDIQLKVKKAGGKQSEINFTVMPDAAYDKPYAEFIGSFYDTGLLNYTSGSVLQIPAALKYSFGLPPDSFMKGQSLSISANNVLTRNIPCVIYDEVLQKKWRFIIKTYPLNAGVFSRRDLPFYITDWDTITFTDQNFIYKIDSQYWELPKDSLKLDRSVSHMISWQNLEYEQGNPIEFFILPPKPQLITQKQGDGSIVYSIEGDPSYSLGILNSDNDSYDELFIKVGVDTFYGDAINGTLNLGLFTNSIYQGKIPVPYEINKRPPATPLITPSTKSFYSREDVVVEVLGQNNTDLFVSISEPYIISNMASSYEMNDPTFVNVQMRPYEKVNGNKFVCNLQPRAEGAVYYKVKAYSSSSVNTGAVAEYSVIIDEYNYYYDAQAQFSKEDGTAENPFTSFEQCLNAINKGRNSSIRVKGNMIIPNGKIELLTNCTIENDGNATIVFMPESSITIKNSTLTINNCRIISAENNVYAGSKLISLFKLENSVLDFVNVQGSVNLGKNAVLVDSTNSSYNILNSILALSASSYGSILSAVRTNLTIQSSSINVTADTAVSFSVNQGNINIKNTSLKVTGQKGRIGEFFDTKGIASDNYFKAELKKSANGKAIYRDAAAETKLQLINNESYGF